MRTATALCSRLPGCAACRRGTRHPLAQGELCGRVPRTRVRALPRGTRGRTHAKSRRALQPRGEIRRRPRLRQAARRRAFCDRPLRAHRERPRLLRGLDRNKDQSYFLHALDAAQLAFCEFPVGGLRKPEVRAIARDRGIPVAGKRDSTGICFIGERPFGDFVGQWLPGQGRSSASTGPSSAATRASNATRSARGARLGIGGQKGESRRPGSSPPRTSPAMPSSWSRAPTIPRFTAPACTRSSCTGSRGRRQPMPSTARRRCAIASRTSLAASRRLQAAPMCASPEPLRGAAPGQYVVFYDGEECLGGAVIMALHPLEDSCRTASRPAASSKPAAAVTSIARSTRSPSPTSDASLLAEDPARGTCCVTRMARASLATTSWRSPRRTRENYRARNRLHAGARHHAGLHRRAGGRRPRRHARRHGQARRRPGPHQPADSGRARDRPFGAWWTTTAPRIR